MAVKIICYLIENCFKDIFLRNEQEELINCELFTKFFNKINFSIFNNFQ